jgi:hypothetical protein
MKQQRLTANAKYLGWEKPSTETHFLANQSLRYKMEKKHTENKRTNKQKHEISTT